MTMLPVNGCRCSPGCRRKSCHRRQPPPMVVFPPRPAAKIFPAVERPPESVSLPVLAIRKVVLAIRKVWPLNSVPRANSTSPLPPPNKVVWRSIGPA